MDRGMKRSLAPGTLPKQPKKPRLINLDPRSSPLQYLNTVRPGLDFRVERTAGGPAHEPKFSVTVVVDGCVYTGRGKSKKHAKQFAAVEALKVMLNEPGLQFVDDSPKGPIIAPMAPGTEEKVPEDAAAVTNPAVSYLGKTPVQILNEIDTTAEYRCIAEDPVNLPRRFTMAVTVKGVTYRAFGANKKQAKHAAARCALIAMGTPVGGAEAAAEGALADLQNSIQSGTGPASQILADRIGTNVLYRFEEVMRNRPDKKPWKVLAGTGGYVRNGGSAGGQHGKQNHHQQSGYYKTQSYYQQQQQQPESAQQSQQYRPVVKRSSGLYAVKFVPAANSQQRTGWPSENINTNGHSNVDNADISAGRGVATAQTNYTTSQAPYQMGQADSNAWYSYDRYRAPARGPATVSATVIQVSTPRSGGKAVPFAQTVSPSQPQWTRGWTESGDWQYHNSYYSNGDTLQQDVSTGHYNPAWEYGYSQDGSTYSGYGSSQVVVASAPQPLAPSRNVNDHNGMWAGRY